MILCESLSQSAYGSIRAGSHRIKEKEGVIKTSKIRIFKIAIYGQVEFHYVVIRIKIVRS
jgi:hypothetical protein